MLPILANKGITLTNIGEYRLLVNTVLQVPHRRTTPRTNPDRNEKADTNESGHQSQSVLYSTSFDVVGVVLRLFCMTVEMR
jgi:hypothetical protein